MHHLIFDFKKYINIGKHRQETEKGMLSII